MQNIYDVAGELVWLISEPALMIRRHRVSLLPQPEIKMNGLRSKISAAYLLPLREKLWFLSFLPYSGLIRIAILTLPCRWLARTYGQYHRNYQLSPMVSEEQCQLARRIGKIAQLAARHTPWESKCLVQALMVRTLLGFYDIPYVLCLGARRTGETVEPIKAHAWVKVGPWIVIGGEGHKAFGVTACFVEKSIVTCGPIKSKFRDPL